MKKNYQNLEKKINVKFKDANLLTQSLTHKSYNSLKNNEKIEFLGDRVLGLVIAKKLLEIYPDEKEGILDKKFASLVNKRTCLEIDNTYSDVFYNRALVFRSLLCHASAYKDLNDAIKHTKSLKKRRIYRLAQAFIQRELGYFKHAGDDLKKNMTKKEYSDFLEKSFKKREYDNS